MPHAPSESRRQTGRQLIAAAAMAAAALLMIVAAGPARAAAPGSLDTSFGTSGVATTPPNTRLFGASAQSDGKVVAVGESLSGSTPTVLVARFDTNGKLDPSFGTGGIVTGPSLSGGPGSIGRAVAVQGDGKIVVVGTVTGKDGSGQDGILVERYDPNGSLDTGFGDHGVRVGFASQFGDGYSVAIQPGGAIVAGGAANSTGNGGVAPRVALMRLTAAGAPDTSFGSGGSEILDLGAYSYALALSAAPGDKIVLAGSQAPGLQVPNALIGRLNANGSLDGSFASGGAYAHQYAHGAASSTFNAVAVEPDGSVVAAGAAAAASSGADAIAARFTSAGAVDSSFGSGGVTYLPSAVNYTVTGASIPGAQAVRLASNGEIVLAGYSANRLSDYATLWALTAAGAPDQGFGSAGEVTEQPGSQNAQFAGLAVGSGGALVGVGTSNPIVGGQPHGIAMRFTGFSGATPSPAGNSRTELIGRMGFVSPGSVIGVELGCFHGSTRCRGHLEMTAGGTVVGQRDFNLAPESGGFQNLKLTAAGRKLLKHNRRFHLLGVSVTVAPAGAQQFTKLLSLARWVWGRGPGGNSSAGGSAGPTIAAPGSDSSFALMGRMGFVSPGDVIGVELGCFRGATRCSGRITMTHGSVVVGQRTFNIAPASGGFQNLKLTSAGHSLLAANRTWQLLGVRVTVTANDGQRASAVMHLARWVWN